MNLFVVGWSPQGSVDAAAGERALRKLLEGLPFFQDEPVETWTAASGTACAACVAHPHDQTCGIRYRHFDPEHLALFSGRPMRWAADGTGEGRGPLVPSHYLHPPETWMRDLDGRCVAVRCCDGPRTLEVFSDPMGAYPVYTTGVGPVTWISNNAEALRLLNGSDELIEHAERRLGIRVGNTTADGVFTLEGVECIAACTEAPCLQVNYRYFHRIANDEFDALVDDLRAGRRDDIPPHGTLAKVRQHVDPERVAGVAPPVGSEQPVWLRDTPALQDSQPA